MEQYTVTGMSCAACSARVEKVVSKVDGVTSCSVSLLTNSMGVEGNADSNDIIRAVEKAGYGASLKGQKEKEKSSDDIQDRETENIVKRLIASLVFLLPLMYMSMGHMMWNFPLPPFLAGNHVAVGICEMLLSALVMIVNQKFFINGWKGIVSGAPNMDTLVAMGSGVSFVYSVFSLLMMTDAAMNGNAGKVSEYMNEFYFESAAMILTLITVGKLLESYSKGRTTDAVKSLIKLSPGTANIIVDGEEKEVGSEKVKKGDIFVVRPGESIPADGIIIEGITSVNESSLTGESIPVDKKTGDSVSAVTINQSGFIKCEATGVGDDTAFSQIIKMVTDAAATKAPIAKIADRVSGIFVPVVLAVALITVIIWLIAGESVGFAITRGISVLVISCPCALGLATPVAIMVGNGRGAKNGILFKTSESLEITGKADIVVLDKTGTITEGVPKVTDIYPAEGYDREEFLRIAYSLEQKSEHPLANAITSKCQDEHIETYEIKEFEAKVGNGLTGVLEDKILAGGKQSFIETFVTIEGNTKKLSEELANEGKTPLFFSIGNKFAGMIAVADVMKEESQKAVLELKNMGMRVVMLTGDNRLTAEAIGKSAGVDEVEAEVLPDGKEKVIRKLKEQGRVIMVGDGINDAPALTSADIGMAIGRGTDVAIDAADIVLMKSSLSDVPAAIRLSRATLRNIRENLFWAFCYNIIGIPLAAGLWYPIFGWKLHPMFGAAAMSLSSFCVISNALRLNFFAIYGNKKDKKINYNTKKEEVTDMEKMMEIEGMMCGHCEARVKKCLEAIPQVKEAVVSHEKNSAVVTLSEAVDDDVLRKAVEDNDYKVLSIR